MNEITAAMQSKIGREELEYLKMVLAVKFHDIDLVEQETRISTQIIDNSYIIERYTIDMLASGKAKGTIEGYTRAVRCLLGDLKKDYRNVVWQDVSDYLAMRQYKDQISINYKATLNRYFAVFFKWAYRKRHMHEDITRDCENIKVQQKKKEKLSEEEKQTIRDICRNNLRELAIVDLLFSTGLRIGELISLSRSDINWDNRTISVYGEKTDTYRTVFLDVKAAKHIKDYLDARNDVNDALFVSQREPKKRIGKAGMNLILKEIGKKAGISMKTTCHLFRKTFASDMYQKSNDIVFVSKLLGHSSTEVTLKYYIIDNIDEMRMKHNRVAG